MDEYAGSTQSASDDVILSNLNCVTDLDNTVFQYRIKDTSNTNDWFNVDNNVSQSSCKTLIHVTIYSETCSNTSMQQLNKSMTETAMSYIYLYIANNCFLYESL